MNIQSTNAIQKTACEIVMSYINACNTEAIYAMLIEDEVNLEVKDKIGNTPLHVLTDIKLKF